MVSLILKVKFNDKIKIVYFSAQALQVLEKCQSLADLMKTQKSKK